MKGIQGLIVAIGLGVAGALLDWAYLASRSGQDATVSFVGIKDGQTVNRGEILHEDQIAEVKIPERWVGNLKGFVELYEGKAALIGRPVCRTLSGPCYLMMDDLKTPPEALKLEEGENIEWITVESRSFVPSLISPGDEVMFLVPRITPAVRGKPGAEPAATPDEPGAERAAPAATKEIGPFRVRSLGNRLGSAQVWAAAKLSAGSENVIGISVKAEDKAKAQELRDVLQATNYRQVGIMKLGPPAKQPHTP